MKIWELSTSDVNISSYYLAEENKVEKFMNMMETMYDEYRLFSKDWEPLVLLKSDQCIDTDFFDIMDTSALIASEEGVVLLQAFLEINDMETLPFLNDERNLFLINIVKTVDCLDKKKSVYESLDNGLILDYDSLVFDYSKVSNYPIFKIPELPYITFITTTFHFFYEEMELKGINFSDDNLIYVD